MKRKPINKLNSSTDKSFIINKIDDAIDSLNKNEEELSKVLVELTKRQLSESEQKIISNLYESYTKSARTVEDIIDK